MNVAATIAATQPTVQRPGPAARRLYQHPLFDRLALALLLVVFAALSLDYLRSDLWMDETLTLVTYVQRGSFSTVFTSYKVANNHILFSALLRLWVWLIENGSEQVLRLPCLLLAGGTVALCFHHGRRLFDRAAGFCLALLMAFSPVAMGFYHQLRGYGLSIFLATAATFGAFYLLRADRRRGLAWFVPAALLMPGALPTNVLVSGGLWLFLNVGWWRAGQWRRRWGLLAVTGAAVAGGMLIYVPIWGKFMRVARETGGWDSGALVAGHWLLALVAHGGMFVVALLALRRQPQVRAAAAAEKPLPVQELLPWLALCCLLPLLAFALWRAPYPRSLLGFLPPLTVCLLYVHRVAAFQRNLYFYLMVFFVAGNALVWTRVADWHTQRGLERGAYPQNLLEHFYGRRKDLTATMNYLRSAAMLPPNLVIFTDFHLYHPFSIYWDNAGGYVQQLECLNGGELFPLKRPLAVYRHAPQVVLAYDHDSALAAYRQATGLEASFVLLAAPAELRLYQVLAPRPPPPTKPPPPDKPPLIEL